MGLEVSAHAKYSDNAFREFRNPCSNYDNAEMTMWTKVQDT